MDHWRVWFAYNQKSFCSGKSVDAATLATLSSQVSEDEVCGPPPVAKILTWLSAVFRRARFFWLSHQHCSWGPLLFETPVTALTGRPSLPMPFFCSSTRPNQSFLIPIDAFLRRSEKRPSLFRTSWSYTTVTIVCCLFVSPWLVKK